jgi:hypothetical protein
MYTCKLIHSYNSAESKDGSLAWASYWTTNIISNQIFVTSVVMEKVPKTTGYKFSHIHRGAGVTV